MESNKLGNSIVKAAWIVSVAAIVCVSINAITKERYTPLNHQYGWYIDQRTGISYRASGTPILTIPHQKEQ